MIKIEAIPDFVVGFYALVARKSPFMRDIRSAIAQDVCAKISSGRILDIGTGPGYLPLEIVKRSPNFEITGIDLSSGMIVAAQKNAKKSGLLNRVGFELANAASLPFADKSFDLVISTFSLHHWSNPAQCFQEIFRVLKDKGEAHIYDFRKDISDKVKRQIREKYGFFFSRLFIAIARAHAFATKEKAESFLFALEAKFTKKTVQDQGAVLKLELQK